MAEWVQRTLNVEIYKISPHIAHQGTQKHSFWRSCLYLNIAFSDLCRFSPQTDAFTAGHHRAWRNWQIFPLPTQNLRFSHWAPHVLTKICFVACMLCERVPECLWGGFASHSSEIPWETLILNICHINNCQTSLRWIWKAVTINVSLCFCLVWTEKNPPLTFWVSLPL